MYSSPVTLKVALILNVRLLEFKGLFWLWWVAVMLTFNTSLLNLHYWSAGHGHGPSVEVMSTSPASVNMTDFAPRLTCGPDIEILLQIEIFELEKTPLKLSCALFQEVFLLVLNIFCSGWVRFSAFANIYYTHKFLLTFQSNSNLKATLWC